jgi:hypothetical protein
MTAALFVPDGEVLVPTGFARGPWDPGAQHGGPPAALLARAIEAVAAPAPMSVARMTVELLRPVPMTPLRVAARLLRPGRKVQLLDATMHAGDIEVARASALRIRREEMPAPPGQVDGPLPWGGPEEGVHDAPSTLSTLLAGQDSFPTTGADLRFVRGRFEQQGPATVWIRLAVPVVEGEEPSSLMRVAAAADFGNGVSAMLGWSDMFINPDLTIYLHRPLVGEWVCLDAQTRIGAGSGLAWSELYDRAGMIGVSLQALYVEQRTPH